MSSPLLLPYISFFDSDQNYNDPSAENTLELTAERLNNAFINGIYILPAFRSDRQFAFLEIRPIDLVYGSEDPFRLTEILAKLGRILKVDVVIVDLRAGLSEISAGLMLDQRVYRVIVTTLSGQSIQGTKLLLNLLTQFAPSVKEEHPLPAIIIAQIAEEHHHSGIVEEIEQELLESAREFLIGDQELLRIETMFDTCLTALPTSWEEIINRIDRCELIDNLHPLIQWLPITPISQSTPKTEIELRVRRQELSNFAKRMVYAERGEGQGFLAIKPLQRLASDNKNEPPIAVVVGAKGAGKLILSFNVYDKKHGKRSHKQLE